MVCSICGAIDKHVAASCPKRPRFFDRAIALVAILFIVGGSAWGHSFYDRECCSNQDCEPVSAVAYVASDSSRLPVMVVTTSHGTRPVTPHTSIRESKDGRMHGCIFGEFLLCLYVPPGS
jgi:hypothetical protein